MATTTLLNAVTGNTTGTGVAITGDFELQVDGQTGFGEMCLERSVDDVSANYKPAGSKSRFNGAGFIAIRNVGTNFYRCRLSKCKTTAALTAKAVQ